ncbi:hypothetical protein BC03BB108_3153 [Bacillus cereus 03BB108]|uniref:Uncharacterized protein n=1 Tax=Bacillus cereus (strain 03BB102) TaxID=572264 RepID=A0A158RQC5_BACC3|nr:hypothetical protein BCA_3304 [Bacillus cereus 03BB102]EDX65263.1 hypothetical protein BC03BB108_3153 [Bacillus cereus 03BB108]
MHEKEGCYFLQSVTVMIISWSYSIRKINHHEWRGDSFF